MIVSDTNLLVYLYVPGERTEQAEAVLARDAQWAAPLLWRSELRNALADLIGRRGLALDTAVQIMVEAERFMGGREYGVLSYRVLQLAASSRCSAYDCELIALAEDLGVPLVTSDHRVLRSFPRIAVTPETFAR